MKTTEKAHAKLNLALHVVGQRDDGYHLIDTLVTFTALADEIELRSSPKAALKIDGPFAAALQGERDNILTIVFERMLAAARAMGQRPDPLTIYLTKNLPVASGIGGGSADAAALIRALLVHWQLDHRFINLAKMTSELGADVPMCFASAPLRATGIGEVLSPVIMPKLPIVLVNPGVAVATPDIFKALRTKDNPPLKAPVAFSSVADVAAFISQSENHLQPPAMASQPVIANVLASLGKQPGALATRMSGSGATCFALFETAGKARAAAKAIGRENPDWWAIATHTLASE